MKACPLRGRWMAGGCLVISLLAGLAQVPPRLQVSPPDATNGWFRLSSTVHTNRLLALSASSNLLAWQMIGTFHDALFPYPDAASPGRAHRFYRLLSSPRGPEDDWKNQALFPEESFQSADAAQNIHWVKFSILVDDPTRVYYQDSAKYPFHYDFATLRLPPFRGMSYTEFDAVSLRRTNQQVVLGTLLYPPMMTFGEYGVQFVGLDAYTPQEIRSWFELVKATVHTTNNAQALYMPTFEQSDVARTNAALFASMGIHIAAADRWAEVMTCYSTGWALGRLRFFVAAEVAAAFADGRLLPGDILLTDGVPVDTPLVAGILTLTPSTPGSHTALLSQSFGIPFAYVPDAAEQARVLALVGRKVLLRATLPYGAAEVKVIDLEGALDPALESQLLALKLPRPFQFLPKQSYGGFWAPTDALVPADIRFFGGKAANFGLLRRAIPTNSPNAIAFSFDLWNAFMDQPLTPSLTLRAEIAARLAPYTNYPPDIPSFKATLAGIRSLITSTAGFNPGQREIITNALAPFFDPLRKIRFRSSTNVEDSEHFTGAGLYDSYSGCLLDDLDGDPSGPSRCDATEANERGVFRAIQRVYASFYNDDAVLERLMHRVDETQVAMGVLVHHSFPDEDELANGVAFPHFSFSPYSTNISGDIVTQAGAVSVTNPDGRSVPEIARFSRYNTSASFTLNQYSSLLPLGATVMDWEADYRGFLELFARVSYEFRRFYSARNNFTLDFEFKKDRYLGLVVKQVREVPSATATNSITAYLLHEPVTCSVFQAEGGDAFANHRLKSIWNLQTANLRLSPSNLVNGIYPAGEYQFAQNGSFQALSGPLGSWPNASNSPAGDINYWTTGAGTDLRGWRLKTVLTTNVTGADPPVFTQADFRRTVTVTYPAPVPTIAFDMPGTTLSDTVVLQPRPALEPGAILEEREFVKTNVITVQTSFYWPRVPSGGIIIYTAPLLQFRETRINGLTADAIVLTNYFSQTYLPGHHNFSEEFIFEPRLEPGLPAATLAQLTAANIQLIYVFSDTGGNATFYVMGLDQKLRRLSP